MNGTDVKIEEALRQQLQLLQQQLFDLLERERERDKIIKHLVVDNKQLVAENKQLAVENKNLKEENLKLQELVARLKKNSSNSSKPPSSDFIAQTKTSNKRSSNKKRHIGGQKGHTKHQSNLTINDADNIEKYHADKLSENSCRNLVLADDLQAKIMFQYELVDKPIELTAYVSYPYRDKKTGEIIYAPFAKELINAGILGSRLTALTACLKGGIHASYTGVEKVLGFLGADVCRGTICKKIKNVTAALNFPYNELLEALPNEKLLNIDETGHKDNPFGKPADHKKHWTWVFAAASFTTFCIFASRSTDALRTVLGRDCEAIIGSDFYSVYKCFMKEANVKIQFCWAHLIRDIIFISESSNKTTANYGRKLMKYCEDIFHLYHQREKLKEEVFQRRMLKLKQDFLAVGRRSDAAGTRNMTRRLKEYGENYFLFLEHPQVEPTNNLAEREVRHCVIDRRVTQGTRGLAGQRWNERIWSVLATCARKNCDAFAFIADSISCYYANKPQPSLLNINS